jgi:hypothetical protein
VTRGLALAGLLSTALAGCAEDNEHPPDLLLRDSLGLAATDPVLRVEISAADNRERARPAEVRVPRDGFVEFRTADRRLHTVRFVLDGLPPDAADFLRSTEQVASPPLLELDARFVVSFREAPDGRYPYVVEGNGEPARGSVVVGSEGGP